MISEASCDTKDWSNDSVNNTALHHRNKLHLKYIKIEYSYFKFKYFTLLLQCYYTFCCIFYQINAALVSIRDLENIVWGLYWPQTFAW